MDTYFFHCKARPYKTPVSYSRVPCFLFVIFYLVFGSI